MEDFYETRIDGVDGEIVGLFGVFDDVSPVSFCRSIIIAVSLLYPSEHRFH
ncbi:unnamed protein product [Camellia sinensis]